MCVCFTGCSKIKRNGNEVVGVDAPLFKTGSGKSMSLKQSSIAKALSVLGDVDDEFSVLGKL